MQWPRLTVGPPIAWSSRDIPIFDRLVCAGKVRAIGASNLKVWRIAEANAVATAHGWAPYCVVEQRHTYLRPLGLCRQSTRDRGQQSEGVAHRRSQCSGHGSRLGPLLRGRAETYLSSTAWSVQAKYARSGPAI